MLLVALVTQYSQANEIAERKRTIADKETRIFQLKKKTQELEKFKFVLDYKINTWKEMEKHYKHLAQKSN